MDCGVGGRGCNLDYDKNGMASRFTLSLRVQHRREKMDVVCLEEKFEVSKEILVSSAAFIMSRHNLRFIVVFITISNLCLLL